MCVRVVWWDVVSNGREIPKPNKDRNGLYCMEVLLPATPGHAAGAARPSPMAAPATPPTRGSRPRPTPRAQLRPHRPESTGPRPECRPGRAPSPSDTHPEASPNPSARLPPSARTKLPQPASAARADDAAGLGVRRRVVGRGSWRLQGSDRGEADKNRGVGGPLRAGPSGRNSKGGRYHGLRLLSPLARRSSQPPRGGSVRASHLRR